MSLVAEIMNRLSSQSVGGLTSTATWRIVGRDFLPGSIGGSTQAQQICVTPTGGFDQEQVDSLTYPTFQVRIRGSSTSSTGLEEKSYDVVGALNLIGRYTPYGTMYLLTDANAAADSQVLTSFTPTGTGTTTLTFDVKKGTSTQSVVQFYRSSTGTSVANATITWTGTVPTVTASTGTVSSTTLIGEGIYRVVLSGTVAAADAHWVLVKIANAVAATSTGTVYMGNWACSRGTITAAMTSWSTAFSPTVAVERDFPEYLDINQQGDLLYLSRDEAQRPIYAVNFVAFRSRTT